VAGYHRELAEMSGGALQAMSMQEQIAPILQRIADTIVPLIDGEWSVIGVTGEMAEGALALTCWYQSDPQTAERSFFAPPEVLHEFVALWLALKAQTGEGWAQVRLALRPDGAFDVDFSYPPLDEPR